MTAIRRWRSAKPVDTLPAPWDGNIGAVVTDNQIARLEAVVRNEPVVPGAADMLPSGVDLYRVEFQTSETADGADLWRWTVLACGYDDAVTHVREQARRLGIVIDRGNARASLFDQVEFVSPEAAVAPELLLTEDEHKRLVHLLICLSSMRGDRRRQVYEAHADLVVRAMSYAVALDSAFADYRAEAAAAGRTQAAEAAFEAHAATLREDTDAALVLVRY